MYSYRLVRSYILHSLDCIDVIWENFSSDKCYHMLRVGRSGGRARSKWQDKAKARQKIHVETCIHLGKLTKHQIIETNMETNMDTNMETEFKCGRCRPGHAFLFPSSINFAASTPLNSGYPFTFPTATPAFHLPACLLAIHLVL